VTRPLSPRQRDVVALVARGLTNKEIGVQLGIAEETVKHHVSGALAFADLGTRTELALWWVREHADMSEPEPRPRDRIAWTLVVAVILAHLADFATHLVMPAWAERNPLIHDMHTDAALLAKVALVVLVLALQPPLRPKYSAVGDLLAVVAIVVGCLGAGSNLAVLSSVNAAETPRSAPEPAPIASEATGIEQGTLVPAAPARIPAPRLVRHEAPDVPRGMASWYAAAGLVAAAGPELRRALGRRWRGRVVRVFAGDRSVAVRLTDWCQCYRGTAGERLVDLGDEAFDRLAPLAAGLIVVHVEQLRIVPPATDAE
jgi:DNA-binding CsgD family transcriptional regulator